jgi:hypothetical protein
MYALPNWTEASYVSSACVTAFPLRLSCQDAYIASFEEATPTLIR